MYARVLASLCIQNCYMGCMKQNNRKTQLLIYNKSKEKLPGSTLPEFPAEIGWVSI